MEETEAREDVGTGPDTMVSVLSANTSQCLSASEEDGVLGKEGGGKSRHY